MAAGSCDLPDERRGEQGKEPRAWHQSGVADLAGSVASATRLAGLRRPAAVPPPNLDAWLRPRVSSTGQIGKTRESGPDVVHAGIYNSDAEFAKKSVRPPSTQFAVLHRPVSLAETAGCRGIVDKFPAAAAGQNLGVHDAAPDASNARRQISAGTAHPSIIICRLRSAVRQPPKLPQGGRDLHHRQHVGVLHRHVVKIGEVRTLMPVRSAFLRHDGAVTM